MTIDNYYNNMPPNFNIRKQKKLIGLQLLDEARTLHSLGVAITKIHTRLHLDTHWSYGTTRQILKEDFLHNHEQSRPPWLQPTPTIQSPPTAWAYLGTFPSGEWVETSKETI